MRKWKRCTLSLLITLIIYSVGYYVCYRLSRGSNYVYIANWFHHNRLLYVWVLSYFFCLIGYEKTGVISAAACFIGMFIGEWLGRWIIVQRNAELEEKIAAGFEATAQDIYYVNKHQGVFIWVGFMLVVFVLCALIEGITNKRKRLSRYRTHA